MATRIESKSRKVKKTAVRPKPPSQEAPALEEPKRSRKEKTADSDV